MNSSRLRGVSWGAGVAAGALLLAAVPMTGAVAAVAPPAGSTPPAAAPAGSDALVNAPRALRVGGLDRGFDDFLAPRAPWPGLLPLVAGTTVDVELRWRAPISVRGGTLRVLLPDAFDVQRVRPVRQVNGYGFAPPPREGAFTVRPSAAFQNGYRPRGHCTPVPGGASSQRATRTERGWRLAVDDVTCAPGEVLRLRVYGVTLPDTASTVRVPWLLRGAPLLRATTGDATAARAVGAASVQVVEPSTSRIEVVAPPTYQLVRDVVDGQPRQSVTAQPITVTVSIVRPDGSPDTSWAGWLTVSPDVVATAYRSPCDARRIPVYVGPDDGGRVTVPRVRMIRDEPGYVNVWAGDHGLQPGSSARVEPLPPVDGLPYRPSTVCPISYH